MKRWSSTATEHGARHFCVCCLSDRRGGLQLAASRLAHKNSKSHGKDWIPDILEHSPWFGAGRGREGKKVDPQLSRSPLFGGAPSVHDVCKVNFSLQLQRREHLRICAAQPTDDVRVLPRPGGQWEWPAARIVAMGEPCHAIAGGAYGRRR